MADIRSYFSRANPAKRSSEMKTLRGKGAKKKKAAAASSVSTSNTVIVGRTPEGSKATRKGKNATARKIHSAQEDEVTVGKVSMSTITPSFTRTSSRKVAQKNTATLALKKASPIKESPIKSQKARAARKRSNRYNSPGRVVAASPEANTSKRGSSKKSSPKKSSPKKITSVESPDIFGTKVDAEMNATVIVSSPSKRSRLNQRDKEDKTAATVSKSDSIEPQPVVVTPTDKNVDESDMSEYERSRLEKIRINQERLKQLGLATEAPAEISAIIDISECTPNKTSGPTRKRKMQRKPPERVEGTRRSKRSRGEQPDYTGETIDRFGDDLDAIAGKKAVSAPKKEMKEILGEAREMFLKSRQVLASKVDGALGNAVETCSKDENKWRKKAIDLWGQRVSQVKPSSWCDYVKSRMSTPPPASPYFLLQEIYAPDTWKLLVACTLMSRVSSADTKHKCLGAFFNRCPTPSAALDADPSEILPCIAPLGLFENRIRSVLSVSEKFLEMDVFDVGLEPENKIYGIGEFGVDSFNIFCRNLGNMMTPKDKNLRAFTSWLQSSGKSDPVVVYAPKVETKIESNEHTSVKEELV